MLRKIINDYVNDWIIRCTDEAYDSYGALLGDKKINLHVPAESELSSAMSKIICRLRKKFAAKGVIPTESVCIIWDIGNCNIDVDKYMPKYDDCCKVIFVSDKTDMGRRMPDGALGLYCGNIYGAGLCDSTSSKQIDNNSTGVMQFFLAQLFMASAFDKLVKGIYYAGNGVCGINSVQLLADWGFAPVISPEDERYMLDFSKEHPDDKFYFGNTYGGELQLLHEMLLKCLLEFDRVCRKHNIKYYLGGGTLMGAVRHGGIIPWDDDVDVMMLRPDYERFLKVIEAELDPYMFFQSSETDKYYHSVFTKIRLNGTKLVTRFSSGFPQMHQGIFIDIFVHDRTSKYKPMQKLHQFLTLFARSMVFHKWEQTPMHFYGKFKLLCKAATWYIYRTPIKKLEKFQERVLRLYEKKHTGYLYDGTGEHLRHGAFPEKWLGTPEYTDFSGHMLPIPEFSDNYLRYSYGDYRKWPSASLRKAGHDIIDADFGAYKTNKE